MWNFACLLAKLAGCCFLQLKGRDLAGLDVGEERKSGEEKKF